MKNKTFIDRKLKQELNNFYKMSKWTYDLNLFD